MHQSIALPYPSPMALVKHFGNAYKTQLKPTNMFTRTSNLTNQWKQQMLTSKTILKEIEHVNNNKQKIQIPLGIKVMNARNSPYSSYSGWEWQWTRAIYFEQAQNRATTTKQSPSNWMFEWHLFTDAIDNDEIRRVKTDCKISGK